MEMDAMPMKVEGYKTATIYQLSNGKYYGEISPYGRTGSFLNIKELKNHIDMLNRDFLGRD